MVKTQFGIKDLENLSNVKAHTIRIWEKRYNLLEPNRTDTNIRKYDLESLKKLLNVVYLYNEGHKISTLASLTKTELQNLVKENILELNTEYACNVLKTAMFEFDSELFDATVRKLIEQKSFREVFLEVFVPLLNETGILWHSGTIDPSHEHFISEKIRHLIIQQYNFVKNSPKGKENKIFVLYLPLKEIHDIGLLFANYELLSAGYNTIYLGANVPLDSLKHILKAQSEIVFVTYFTVEPEPDQVENYISEFQKKVGDTKPCELWILGRKIDQLVNTCKNIRVFNSLELFTQQIEKIL
ncbi:MerR family transcriptional regulator [Aequorivita sediminis]|uniref:MerR family transcriptional regulator n=1 Tax=Aequorivita sediminis TaxID=3073653 RepID=UPI0028A8AB8A|nr:MerR family transcriptional regulator [Aequorivita sp. F6058]